jgi:mRNA-degrading endonuclease RelE of RelBE toxin-antitoxin system
MRALDKPVAARILKVLERLEVTPRPARCVPLTGRPGVLRVKAAQHWRIVYEVHDDTRTVVVLDLGHRSTIYDR